MIRHYLQLWRQRRNLHQFESQLVEGLTFIANALRAGLSLPQAIEMTSTEMSGAFAEEMQCLCDQLQVGVPLSDALQDSASRLPVADWRMSVQAACILLEMGGNLIESFQLILETIRDRQRVSSKIYTATTQGKMQAGIIAAMPFAITILLAYVTPDYVAPLFTWPMGAGICAMGLLMLSGGVVWMQFILRIEV